MPNHKSAEKALKQSLKKREKNSIRKSRVKTFIRKVDDAITAGDKENAGKALRKAESVIMKAVSKKVIKLNTASRKISRLSAKVKNIKVSA